MQAGDPTREFSPMPSYVSAEAAVGLIESGERVYIQSAAGAPQRLIRAMAARAPELRNVEVVSLHTEGEAPYARPELKESFQVTALFVGPNVREGAMEGRVNFVPVFLSEVPSLFRRRIMPIDVALVQVSPPDRHGFCTLGVSVEATRAAVEVAHKVLAQVNPRMPRTHGDSLVPVSRFAAMVEGEEELPEVHLAQHTPEELAVGRHVAGLVEDGATLQVGIGAIPEAVLAQLKGHRRLGVHSEMFSDGIIDLVEQGAVTGELKKLHPGKIIAGFTMGTRRLYDFVDDNPLVELLDIAYVNDPAIIKQNPKVTAINSCIEVDLTGQVCSDSIGTRIYSGVGGQMDFMRGASLSEGGKPIIALPSVTRKGISRIVPLLKPGAGVVTTRAHVHYVVTEYGVADLFGRNLRQRARALIDIAHPSHRAELAAAAAARFREAL
jgi:4-hydroxybutyrate CoA-transferase